MAAEGAEAVTGLTGVLSLAPHASRTDATQRELHALRLVGWKGLRGWFVAVIAAVVLPGGVKLR